MRSDRTSGRHDGLNVVIADDDPIVVGQVLATLRADGLRVFHAYDGRAAVELALALRCLHLLISNTRIADVPGIELIHQLRAERPDLPVIYLANIGRSTPAIEAQLPPGVPILREPFTAAELLGLVRRLLPAHVERRRNEEDPTGY
jgi:DNA-binding NtrC family response regulator